MKRVVRSDVVALLAIASTLAGALLAFVELGFELGSSLELAVGIGTVLLTLLAGVFSRYVASGVRHLSRSKRVFLSYQGQLSAEAHRLANALNKEGFRVWLDFEHLRPGDSIVDAVKKGIDSSDALVVFLGDLPSPNVAIEIGFAQAKGIRIIPVRFGSAPVPPEIASLKYIEAGAHQAIPDQQVVAAVTGSSEAARYPS
jgi:hypothetical protein